jgi:hypothetical protein
VFTERTRAEIAGRVGPKEERVARAVRDFGGLAHCRGHGENGQPPVDHLARLGAPRAVGLDETSFLVASDDA